MAILNKNLNQRGFTLLEMVVSITIIASISGLFLANISSYRTAGDLNSAALKLATDIRELQLNALSLKEMDGSVPAGGWGLYVRRQSPNNTFYIRFVDNDQGRDYDPSELVSQNFLPAGVIITEVILNGSARTSGLVFFTPPDPTTTICRNSAQCTDENPAEIVLRDSAGKTKTIKVNTFGLIDITN